MCFCTIRVTQLVQDEKKYNIQIFVPKSIYENNKKSFLLVHGTCSGPGSWRTCMLLRHSELKDTGSFLTLIDVKIAKFHCDINSSILLY